MVASNCIALILSEFDTTLLKNIHRSGRVLAPSNLHSINTSLAKIMAEGYENDTLT